MYKDRTYLGVPLKGTNTYHSLDFFNYYQCDPVAMDMTRVEPRGPFYACKHARTHARVFVDIRAGIPAQDGGCYLALDSVMYQATRLSKQQRHCIVIPAGQGTFFS
jgi:hypothetical protein